jgi:signal peptidase I
MSGSGARGGFGSPPWNPSDPPGARETPPGARETRPIPGLSGPPSSGGDRRDSGASDAGARETRPTPGLSGPPESGGDRRGNGASAPGGRSGTRARGFGNWGPKDIPTSVDMPALGTNGAGPGEDTGTDQGTAGGGNKPDGGGPGEGGPDKRGHRAGGRKRPRGRSFWKELPVLIVVALVLALVIKTYAIQAFYIPSGSMQNTLEIGDRVLINKMVYHVRGIARGDIVVFNGNGSWDTGQPQGSSNIFSKFVGDLEDIIGANHDADVYIKRVIGLPGDHVACCNAQGDVTVNGVPLTEGSYLYPGNAPSTTPFNITVPAGRLWVMGDHRAISYDSRGHMGQPGGGTIPENAVMGRAFVIIWPPSRWGFLNIPATFEQPKLTGSAAAAGGSATTLAAAMDNGTPLRAAGSALPLGLGFAGALPLTLLQRSARRRLSARRSRRRARH